MRAAMIRLAGLALLPAALAAQAAPAAAPPARADSAAVPAEPRRSPVHFLLFGYTQSAEVRTSNGGVLLPDESGSLSGVEFLLSARSGGIGLHGRMLTADNGPSVMEGGLLIGSRRFAIDLAYMMRDGYNPDNAQAYDSTYAFARGGFRSRANLGNTGFTLGFRAGYYVGIPSDQDPGPELSGWEGETQLAWSWSRFPLTALMGYRIERFEVWGREQEVSALSIGAGVAFGRR